MKGPAYQPNNLLVGERVGDAVGAGVGAGG